jgi:non-specific serine/threonine protein kinase
VAIKLYEEGIALCRNSGYEVLLADTLVNLGYARLLQRDLEQATKLSEEAIALYRKQGFRHARIAVPVDNLGWAALVRGDVEDAEVKYQESLMLCRELGNELVAAESLQGLACVAGKRGDMERSARLFGAADALFRARNISHDLPEEQELRESYLEDALEQNSAAWEEGSKLTFEEAIEYALSGNQSPPPAHPALEQPSTRE